MDEAPTLAAAQTDPDGFIGGLPERVILDEVQRVPELFRAIKRGVDIDHRPGRLLLTGSAQALVLPRLLGVAGRENESFDALALQPGRNRRTPRRFYRRVLRG
ncbi:MAG: AAA family ATPase [Verrucomicrobiales bacterium]